MATYEQMKNEFLAMPKLAFGCIDAVYPNKTLKELREAFIGTLEKRCKDPKLIAQGNTNLCGVASFMYCVACEYPDEYSKFVLSLAMHGKGSIGSLTVSPPNAAKVDITSNTIAPVDWVALASIRDNSVLSQMTNRTQLHRLEG